MTIIMYFGILFLNALVSLLFLIYKVPINSFYYLVSLFIFFILIYVNKSNMLFFIRTIFLGVIGFIAMGAKLINEFALWGYHMSDSQTVEIATIMFLYTNIALFSSEVGFKLSKITKINYLNVIKNENHIFFWVTFFILLFFAVLMDVSKGPDVIFGPGYALAEDETLDTGLGNLNTIINILFFILVLLYFKFRNINNYDVKSLRKYIFFIGIYIYVYVNFLHGARMDALNALFGLTIIILIYKNKQIRINFKFFIMGIVVFGLMQIIGMLRSVLGDLSLEDSFFVIQKSFSYLIEQPDTGIMFYQGTVNDIATTFSGIIYMLNENIKDFLYGESYFDYILRTPPAFIYPDRPEDLAFIFQNNGLTSGGGFFELAEAYYNFGYLGAFIVPFFVSYFMGYAYKQFFINRYSILSSLLLFALLANFMRGILYQTFALYKGVVTAFILYFILLIISYFIQIFLINSQGTKKNEIIN